MSGTTTVRIVIPIFIEKVELFGCSYEGRVLHSNVIMDHESLLVTLFFTFMLGAGVGFYVARFLF